MRYILLGMYLVRFNVFRNIEDDDITDAFDQLFDPDYKDQITVKNLKLLFPEEIIEEMFAFNLFQNIKDFSSFQKKDDDFKVKLADVYIDEPNEHVLFSEEALIQIIKPIYPSISQKRIRDALTKLRSTMCLVTSLQHPLVHKYDKDYALDDELYDIIFFLGNPYLALRLERLVLAMDDKIKQIEEKLDGLLKLFYSDVLKSNFINKIEKARKIAEDKNEDEELLKYIIVKSKNLPEKFAPNKAVRDSMTYKEWIKIFNQLLVFKYQIIQAHKSIEKIQSFYSGPKQEMSYLKFIEEVTNNEEEISNKIKTALVTIRNNLKDANEVIEITSAKEIKLLNLDLERLVIENDEEDEE